ncbi:MAG TPA: GNAT family N-acetyltransferase [Acidimicrobiales bacterium]|jgi:RimJ/RimL family protein N-acetyltransferase
MAPLVHITSPIETERLALRPFVATDFDALAEIQSRADVARYLYWEPRTRRQVRSALRRRMGMTRIERAGDAVNLAVTLRGEGGGRSGPTRGQVQPMIGDVLLSYTSAVHQQAELGYVFHPEWHGHGYATEAAAALVDLAFRSLRVHRVFAHIDARNERSALLLERLGLRREAHFVENEWVKGEWTNDVYYAVLADEWSARHPPAP